MPNPFNPTAGATPPLLVGRQPVLDTFQESTEDSPSSPYLLQLMTGARGVGKTVMLNELGEMDRATGWVVIHVTAGPGMLDRIVHGRGTAVRSWARWTAPGCPPRGRWPRILPERQGR